MKVWFEKIPLFQPTEEMRPHESIVAEGTIDIERRRMKDDEGLINLSDFVGGFKRENGGSNLSIIESYLAHLNGCKVRVKIEVLEFPKSVASDSKRIDSPQEVEE